MGVFIAGLFVHIIIQAYALVTLMNALPAGVFFSVLLYVLLAGAVAGASICGRCLADFDQDSFLLILLLAALYILPFCVGFLAAVLPAWVYGVIRIVYIVVFAALGVLPALAGGILYLLMGLFGLGSDIQLIAAVIPSFGCGIMLGQRVVAKLCWKGTGADASIRDSKGNWHDIYFH